MSVSNGSVEFFALQNDGVIAGTYDATLAGNRSCSVDVVASYHAYCDASSSTFHYRVGHLSTTWSSMVSRKHCRLLDLRADVSDK